MIQRKRRPSTKIVRDKSKQHLIFSYTQLDVLKKFVSEQGMITPRTRTGLSQKQQRRLASEIKRARHLALLPFTQTL